MTEDQIEITYGEATTIARVYGMEEQDIDDYQQDCVVHVLQHIDQYDPNRGKFKSWVNQVCMNVARTMWRKDKRHRETLERNENGFEYLEDFDTLEGREKDPAKLAEWYELAPQARELYEAE